MRIHKNGRTPGMKKLLKVLRRKRKQQGGGLLDGLFSKSSTELTQAEKNNQRNQAIIDAQNAERLLAVAKVASGAAVAAELLTNAAEPLLAASGVGIPLLAILIVAKKLAKQYKQNLQLNAVLLDVVLIINNCFFLYKLIKKTTWEFAGPLEKALAFESKEVPANPDGGVANPDGGVEAVGGDGENKIGLNSAIEESIKIKLADLNALLQKIAPQEPNKNKMLDFDRINRGFKRFFFSAELKNEIITKLTVINGLFTIYNSQFDWSIRFYESKILNNLPDGKEVLKSVWENIESSEEYKDYLFQESTGDPEKDAMASLSQQPINPEEFNAIQVTTAKAAEQADNTEVNQVTTPQQLAGRRKTNKYKKRKSRSTRKRSRK
jgi:hypothetical protein